MRVLDFLLWDGAGPAEFQQGWTLGIALNSERYRVSHSRLPLSSSNSTDCPLQFTALSRYHDPHPRKAVVRQQLAEEAEP